MIRIRSWRHNLRIGAADRSATARYFLVFTTMIAVLWVTLGVTAATAGSQPIRRTSLAWWPFGVAPRADEANRLLQPGAGTAQPETAMTLARAVLRRDPTNLTAARALGLGLAMSGRGAEAGSAFTYAERLSRRDLATEMWLIESAVGRGAIGSALVHYDRALRVHADAVDLLIPTLVAASSVPAVTPALGSVLARRPLWWSSFYEALLRDSGDWHSVAYLTGRLHLSSHDLAERDLLDRALLGLVERGRYRESFALYRRQRPDTSERHRLTHFYVAEPLGPFDWRLTDQPALGAIVGEQDGIDGDVLTLLADDGQNGAVARQLLLSPPGRYRLDAVLGGVTSASGARAKIMLRCADAPTRVLAELAWPPATTTSAIKLIRPFAVPASGCEAQWLTIEAQAADDGTQSRLWLKSVFIRPVQRTAALRATMPLQVIGNV